MSAIDLLSGVPFERALSDASPLHESEESFLLEDIYFLKALIISSLARYSICLLSGEL